MKNDAFWRTAGFWLIPFLVIATVLGMVAARAVQSENKPKGPTQPATGPGGSASTHSRVVAKMYGTGPTRYWIFEPADPQPESAPVVIFNHGWMAMEPRYYGAWIDHIVMRGNLVIFPVYQDSIHTPMSAFTANAASGIRSAIQTLQTEPGHVKPQVDEVAAVGHSMGGVITANLGAEWNQLGIPRPKALMCVEPGKTWTMSRKTSIKLADLSLIGKDTLLLAIAGDRDRLVKDVDAKRIFNESTNVLPENRNFILTMSDDHGSPSLVANHLAPVATNPRYTDPSVKKGLALWFLERMEKRRLKSSSDSDGDADVNGRTIDALDYYGTWKLFDGLSDAAFYGRHREYALGNTHEQRFMGKWSDGVPVRELQVTTIP